MSLLINVVGITISGIILTAYGSDKVEKMHRVINDDDIAFATNQDLAADMLSIGFNMASVALGAADSIFDKVFDSRAMSWIEDKTRGKVQVRDDGIYFFAKPRPWNGYGDDQPKSKPGKYELDI